MKFLEKISKLSVVFSNDTIKKEENAVLYGLCNVKPIHAKHIIFSPMPEEVLNHLVCSYKRNIPDQLLMLYRTMNGGELFGRTRHLTKANIHIPYYMLSIFGVPLTNTRDHIEPFNISLEDLNRPRTAPDDWLKFGTYYEPNSFNQKCDLFVGTNTADVYAVDHVNHDCKILKQWSSIDCCLCELFDSLNEKF